MRARLLLAALGLGAAMLASCSPPAPSHDKAFYAANASERARQLTECQNDPGRIAATPNCINAQSADADAHAAHFYDVPKAAPRVTDPGKL
jgi:hypothetical protein